MIFFCVIVAFNFCILCLSSFFFKFYFIFKLYNIVLVLPNAFLLNVSLSVPFLHFFASSGDLVSVRRSRNEGGVKRAVALLCASLQGQKVGRRPLGHMATCLLPPLSLLKTSFPRFILPCPKHIVSGAQDPSARFFSCCPPPSFPRGYYCFLIGIRQLYISRAGRSEVKSLSHVRLFATPWTVARQAPLSMGFSRQEYWSGLPFPSPGDLPDPGIEPGSPALRADALTSEPPGKPLVAKRRVCLIIMWQP